MSARLRPISSLLLLACGAALWLSIGGGVRNWHREMPMLAIPAAVGILMMHGGVRRGAVAALDRVQRSVERRRWTAAIFVVALGGAYLAFTAMRQGRYLHPIWHDEFSYALQTQMMAGGHLWLPRHELADFFESFQIITDPVYASMYFPGTALFWVPTVWLGLPTWVGPLIAAALVCGLIFLVVSELTDGLAGIVAVGLMLALSTFRLLSMMILSQVPLVLVGMVVIWAFLRWRQRRGMGWVVVIGATAGWAAIIRPLDALCFALPVGIALIAELWRQPRRVPGTVLILLVSAAPFLGLQLAANRGITGNWTKTAWSLYAERDHPQVRMGFPRYDPAAQPATKLLQKRLFYQLYYEPLVKEDQAGTILRAWWTRKGATVVEHGLPQAMLLVLVPLSLLGMGGKRWVIVAAVPLFVGFYLFYPLMLRHYALAVAPALIFGVLLGVEAIHRTWPGAGGLRAFLYVCLALLSVASLPEARRGVRDQYWEPRVLKAFDDAARRIGPRPAVVLFRFDEGRKLDEEPVYNVDTARVDDARIIRAHDLGARNIEICRYYAAHQPQRRFYLFDEASGELRELGSAEELTSP